MAASEITIDVPASAEVGETVLVSVRTKNISRVYNSFKTVAYATELLMVFIDDIISEESVTHTAQFSMPKWDVIIKVTVDVWRWLVDVATWEWVEDNSKSVVVKLALGEVVFSNLEASYRRV